MGSKEVTANNPFTIRLKQINAFDGATVSEGWGSKNFVRVEVHNAQKLYRTDLIYEQKYIGKIDNIISGPDSVLDRRYNEMIGNKQMTAGEVDIEISLEDVTLPNEEITLNFTLMSRGRPWMQISPYFSPLYSLMTPHDKNGNSSRYFNYVKEYPGVSNMYT